LLQPPGKRILSSARSQQKDVHGPV
jgi:hypothetical protein